MAIFTEGPGGQAKEANVLLLGVGNLLLSDEGIGGRVVEEFQRRYLIPQGVEAIDGGTMGMDLLPYLDDRTHLLVVDAVNTGTGKPGEVVRLELEDPPSFFRTMVSPHQLGLAEVLGVAAMTGTMPPVITVIGIEPASLATGIDLSPVVESQMPRLIEMVRAELTALGFALEPLPMPANA